MSSKQCLLYKTISEANQYNLNIFEEVIKSDLRFRTHVRISKSLVYEQNDNHE